MIHTDGKLTIANHGWESNAVFHDALTERNAVRRPTASERIRQARELREAALDRQCAHCGESLAPGEDHDLDARITIDGRSALTCNLPNRGPQDNGQQWNDDRCACGGEIADSPAGDKCWDCFNWDPGDGPEADDRYIY